MIVFVGAQDRGFFVKETAALKNMNLSYIEQNFSIRQQLNSILECTCRYLIVDIEQYVDAAEVIAEEILRIARAKNCEVIIYAPGYDRESKVIRELEGRGIRYYVFSANIYEARQELERSFMGYYKEPEKESPAEAVEVKKGTKIGVAGICRRIGVTTFAIQLVKYLQMKGFRACYLEVNDTEFVRRHEKRFFTEHDETLGKVVFENVDMFYRQEALPEVLKQNYDYYIYDFGAYTGGSFHKTFFLEKDIRIFVMGTKASEIDDTENVLRNEYYTDVCYVFNFISEKEKKDVLEFMEEKSANTFFTAYAPDQFEYIHNPDFEKLLPVQPAEEVTCEKRSLFFRKKKEKKRR